MKIRITAGILALLLALLAFALVVFLYLCEPDSQYEQKFNLEVAKVLLQLVVIIGAGTVFKVVYDQIRAERDREAVRQEIRKTLHDDLINRRTQVEQIRRSFVIQSAEDQPKKYRESIHDLLRIRIDLARLWHDFEVSKDIFTDSQVIQDMLEDMKGYLDVLIAEYKVNKDKIVATQTSDAFCSKNPIPDFTSYLDAEESYTNYFLLSYRSALKIIRRNMLNEPQEDGFVFIERPKDGEELKPGKIEVIGIVDRESDVSVNMSPAPVEDGKFVTNITLKIGEKVIRATATDRNGNRSSARISVSVSG